jgi:hypothetical protein
MLAGFDRTGSEPSLIDVPLPRWALLMTLLRTRQRESVHELREVPIPRVEEGKWVERLCSCASRLPGGCNVVSSPLLRSVFLSQPKSQAFYDLLLPLNVCRSYSESTEQSLYQEIKGTILADFLATCESMEVVERGD